MSLFELIEASRRVHIPPRRLTAVSFSMRQQKLDKLCRGYKILRPRLTKHCRGRVPGVPGGVDAYAVATSIGSAEALYCFKSFGGLAQRADRKRAEGY